MILGFEKEAAYGGEGGCYGVTSPVISLEFLDVDDAGHTKLLIDVISRDPDCVSKKVTGEPIYSQLPIKYDVFLFDAEYDDAPIAHVEVDSKGDPGFTLVYPYAHVEIPYCVEVVSTWIQNGRTIQLEDVNCT